MMREKRQDFIKSLDKLCGIYSDYLKEYKDSMLDVLIEDNMIKMYLYRNKEIVDEFGLVFNYKEKDSYIYISIVIMKMLFGGKTIYAKDNVFYKNMDGSGFKIIVNDSDLYDRMFGIVPIYRDIDFYDKIDNGRRVRNKINRNRNGNNLDERIELTKKSTNNVKANNNSKSKIAAGLLGILLGCFGAHNFYLGYTGKAVAQLLITLLSCFIFSFVSAIWGLIEGIMILTGSINTDANGNELVD